MLYFYFPSTSTPIPYIYMVFFCPPSGFQPSSTLARLSSLLRNILIMKVRNTHLFTKSRSSSGNHHVSFQANLVKVFGPVAYLTALNVHPTFEPLTSQAPQITNCSYQRSVQSPFLLQAAKSTTGSNLKSTVPRP